MEDISVKQNSLTTVDEYTITPAMARLLEVLLNPDNVGKSITDKCELANISREYYYQMQRKPDFQQLINKSCLDMIKTKVGDILAASLKSACNDGYKGHADRKMLLSMTGLYKDEPTIVNNNIQNILGKMPQDELQGIIQGYIKQHPDVIDVSPIEPINDNNDV